MDKLTTINYSGNQMTGVKDTSNPVTAEGSTDFKGPKDVYMRCSYNGIGSLVRDDSRGIALIEYDDMNNPKRIQFTNGNVTKYVYSATGEKLRTIYQTAVPNITVAAGTAHELTAAEILYTDSVEYYHGGKLTVRNGRLDKYYFDGGYAQATMDEASQSDTFAFFYYTADHIGNIREVIDESGTIQQITSYYPFGTPFATEAGNINADLQTHKYNGKEFDTMHGLNTYDYGARQYNSLIGRWDRMDPLCEKYYSISPYAYCANNPINYIDPNGRELWIYYKDEEEKEHSFQYSVGMNYEHLNSSAQTFVKNFNEMANNPDGLKVLNAIIDSSTKYGFKQADTRAEGGEGYFDMNTNITSLNDPSNTLTLAEETFHTYQRVNNQGGKTAVAEVEAKLFSAKMNCEIDGWANVAYYTKLAGNNIYRESMEKMFREGYSDNLFKIAVDNFFTGSYSGTVYKGIGYKRGAIINNPLIKPFLPANE